MLITDSFENCQHSVREQTTAWGQKAEYISIVFNTLQSACHQAAAIAAEKENQWVKLSPFVSLEEPIQNKWGVRKNFQVLKMVGRLKMPW